MTGAIVLEDALPLIQEFSPSTLYFLLGAQAFRSKLFPGFTFMLVVNN
jgi:hypothetical protein